MSSLVEVDVPILGLEDVEVVLDSVALISSSDRREAPNAGRGGSVRGWSKGSGGSLSGAHDGNISPGNSGAAVGAVAAVGAGVATAGGAVGGLVCVGAAVGADVVVSTCGAIDGLDVVAFVELSPHGGHGRHSAWASVSLPLLKTNSSSDFIRCLSSSGVGLFASFRVSLAFDVKLSPVGSSSRYLEMDWEMSVSFLNMSDTAASNVSTVCVLLASAKTNTCCTSGKHIENIQRTTTRKGTSFGFNLIILSHDVVLGMSTYFVSLMRVCLASSSGRILRPVI